MTVRHDELRLRRLLACLLLQVALLVGVWLTSASLSDPCHQHQAAEIMASSVTRMMEPASLDSRHASKPCPTCGRCQTCCLGPACAGSWLTPPASSLFTSVVFRHMRFAFTPVRRFVGQDALPPIPPPRWDV